MTEDMKVEIATLKAEDRRLEQMILEDRATNKELVSTLFRKIDGLCEELKGIKEKYIGKPTWAVTIVITVLCSMVAGLGVAFISRGGR